ncbi:hypothetical protein HZH66_013709 [Vespula vulgaris]|uniref:Odorant receptor n=1 Tax=Vespula vulgaris TaxID=7454 RepID=A0A834MQF6_VESVU|nr:hypothetical protein HZH66_013709 [Vespula vulgaris]
MTDYQIVGRLFKYVTDIDWRMFIQTSIMADVLCVPSMRDNLDENANFNVQLNRWILKSIGAWPKSSDVSYCQIYLHRLNKTICYALIIFLMIPCGLYLTLEVKDTYDKLRLTGPLSFCLMAIIKYCALNIRENDIRQCFEYIEWDWKKVKHNEDLQIMKENANLSRRIVIVCATFMYSSAAFYYIAVPFARGMITEMDSNVTYRPLVYPVAKIIVDARRSPINEIFFGIQCISGFLTHSITTAACGLAATFAMHACGQLQLIISCLENLVDGREDSNDTIEERLADIVQRHVRALNFISLTEEVLNEISLVEVVGYNYQYLYSQGWQYNETMGRVTYIILFVSVTFNIFIFCYIGELLADQCQKVGERSYMIDWYRLPWKDVRGLVLILAMSNSPNNLTAGYLIELSLTSFGDKISCISFSQIIKSSLAYLNMLRTLTE